MKREGTKSASALLLTVVVIGLITTTTLGTIALTYDQLSSTDRVANSSVAKLAADSGLNRLREKISAGDSSFPEAYNLSKSQTQSVSGSLASFRPSPRDSVFSLETGDAVAALPRCLATAVLSPWTNDGQYQFGAATPTWEYSNFGSGNPALVFYYANIVNGTPLGVVAAETPTNADNSLASDIKALPISSLTKVGQFYNPYAAINQLPSDPGYWTIRFGGPQDQFLTKKDQDGVSSYYKNLDFLYIPFLPRFADSGLLNVGTNGLDRKSGTEIRTLFEDVVKKNNFHIWLDGAVTSDQVYQYGLGDLFTDGTGPVTAEEQKYQLTWIQPTLWNDLPEADSQAGYASSLMGPTVAGGFGAAINADNPPGWSQPARPVKSVGSPDGGWTAQILRGSRSFSFLFPNSNPNQTLTPLTPPLSFNYFGSLEGLRLNQPISLVLMDKTTNQPLWLQNRGGTNQGWLYNVKIVAINTATNSVTIQLSTNSFDTPLKGDGSNIALKDISVMVIHTGVQLATKQSVDSLTINPDGQSVGVPNSSCPNSPPPGQFTVCPAVADIVSLSKAGQKPIWGQVTSVSFNGAGTQMTGFKLDKYREYPRPLQNMAHTSFLDPNDGNKEKIAYYGGQIDANGFDGSVNDGSDELWFYYPAGNSWEYLSNSGPGARIGASMVDTKIGTNENLTLFGGYRHEAIGNLNITGTPSCGDNYYLSACLAANRPNARVAKILPNDVWDFDLTTRTWRQDNNVANNSTPAIADGSNLELRVVSQMADRSGQDGATPSTKAFVNLGGITLNTTPGAATNVQMSPSVTGLAIGDELSLSGQMVAAGPLGADQGWFTAWARVVGFVDSRTVTIKTYGVKDTASVSLKSLTLSIVNRLKGEGTCSWNATDQTCMFTDATGLSVGDAIVLEQYDNFGAPTKLTNSYAGYISQILPNGGNWEVYFISQEKVAGFNDFQTASCNYLTTCAGESIRNRPLGRFGAMFASESTVKNPYLWQGTQADQSYTSRFVETWQYDVSASAWSIIPASLQSVPAATDLSIETIKLPDYPLMFTSNVVSVASSTNTTNPPDNCGPRTQRTGVNVEIIKDDCVKRVRTINGVDVTDYVLDWDHNKTWSIEIADEGNTAWNAERLASGGGLQIERVRTYVDYQGKTQTSREAVNGIITSIDYPGTNTNPGSLIRVNFQHYNGSDDSGLTGDATNAKVLIGYPNWVNGNSLKISGLTKLGASDDAITGNDVGHLTNLPIGSTVIMNRTSENFAGTGQKTDFFTGVIDDKSPTISGGNVTGFTLKAAGPRFLTTPVPVAYAVNGLAGTGGDVLVFHSGEARYHDYNYTLEWENKVSDGQWKVRVSVPAANDRPPPRSDGAVAINRTTNQMFVTGGTNGLFGDVWRLDGVQNTDGGTWKLAKASSQAETDIPQLVGSAFDLLSNDTAVFFGGRRAFDSTAKVGPKVLGQPYNSSNNDGSFSIANQGSNSLASRFTDLTYNQNISPASVRNSLKLSLDGTNKNVSWNSTDGNTICRYLGETICSGQSARLLGTLGSFDTPGGGSSLGILNPGTNFKYEGSVSTSNRSLLLSGPALSIASTNNRWDQEGYTPYQCDNNANGCLNLNGYGTLSKSDEESNPMTKGDKTILLAGFSKIIGDGTTCPVGTACGSVLVTPVGIGSGVDSGQTWEYNYYCSTYTVDGSNNYSCDKTSSNAQYLRFRPNSEDLLFLFNAAKQLSSDEAYKVTGYYGGVRRGYLVNQRSLLTAKGELDVKEIAP